MAQIPQCNATSSWWPSLSLMPLGSSLARPRGSSVMFDLTPLILSVRTSVQRRHCMHAIRMLIARVAPDILLDGLSVNALTLWQRMMKIIPMANAVHIVTFDVPRARMFISCWQVVVLQMTGSFWNESSYTTSHCNCRRALVGDIAGSDPDFARGHGSG